MLAIYVMLPDTAISFLSPAEASPVRLAPRKAIVIESPRGMRTVNLPRPAPGPDEVLLRVAMIGYRGSDLNTCRGVNPLVTYSRMPGDEIGA